MCHYVTDCEIFLHRISYSEDNPRARLRTGQEVFSGNGLEFLVHGIFHKVICKSPYKNRVSCCVFYRDAYRAPYRVIYRVPYRVIYRVPYGVKYGIPYRDPNRVINFIFYLLLSHRIQVYSRDCLNLDFLLYFLRFLKTVLEATLPKRRDF